MTEYIEREVVISIINTAGFWEKEDREVAIACVEQTKAADVAPVKHGKWIEYPRAHYFKCSECKYTVPYRKAMLKNGDREYHYCPHCGAKMDLEGQK